MLMFILVVVKVLLLCIPFLYVVKLTCVSIVQPYLHESRHQHALKRARGAGGRFLNAKSDDNEEHSDSSSKDKQNGVAPRSSNGQPSSSQSPKGVTSADKSGNHE
jgi:nuclear transcription factor Y, alpha